MSDDLDPTRSSDREPEDPNTINPTNVRRLRSSFIGMALLTAVGFVILASLTFLPWWAVLPLTLVWLVVMRTGGIWFADHPRRVLLLPAWMLLGWLAVVFALGLFTDVIKDEPTVDPFPDPPAPPSSSSTPAPGGSPTVEPTSPSGAP